MVKKYLFFRLLTVLLSTSAMATLAMTENDDVFNHHTSPVTNAAHYNSYNKTDEDDIGAHHVNAHEQDDRDVQHKVTGFTLDDVRGYGKIAELAYTDLNNRHQITAKYSAQGYKVAYFNSPAESSGFILLKGNKVIVAYHGTESFRNVATDLWTTKVTSSSLAGRYHKGFYEGFKATWDDVFVAIHKYTQECGYNLKDLDITFTGHSLGGALAGIAATRWAEKINPDNVSVISFGAPKFCDTKAARRIEELLGDRYLRVTQHGYDVVPGVGPGIMGYQHVGQNLRVEAENWGDMHIMSAYNKSLNKLAPAQFKADNSERLLFRGGLFNPLNMVDGVIKYGINEGIIGTVEHAVSGLKKLVMGSSVSVEEILLSGKEGHKELGEKKTKEGVVRLYKENLKIRSHLQEDNSQKMAKLEKQVYSGNKAAAVQLEQLTKAQAQLNQEMMILQKELRAIEYQDANSAKNIMSQSIMVNSH